MPDINPDLARLTQPKTQSEISQLVNSQAQYFPDFARIYIPNHPIQKNQPGYEPSQPLELTNSNPYESDIERSIRRTRKSIKDYVFCNNFDLFATFTFATNRQSIESCKTRMSDWLRNQRKRKGKFQYLIISELHKDKLSLHFHALLKDYPGEIKQSFYDSGLPIKQDGHLVFTIPSYTLGFTNVKKIDPDKYSHLSVAFYLQKYITKDMPLFFGKNRYWASRGLLKPYLEDNPEPFYIGIEPTREYETDHGKIIEIDKGVSPLVDMFIESHWK